MTQNILIYLIINNLVLVYFVGIEDIKLKNSTNLVKKYFMITVISLINYLALFHLYKILEYNNILFLIPIFYAILAYLLILIIKALNEVLIVYKNKKFEYSSELLISSSSLVLISFFAIDKSKEFLEGIEVLFLSLITVLITLMIVIITKKNLEKKEYFDILKYEPMYFFIMFILSLIPSIIMLITKGDF